MYAIAFNKVWREEKKTEEKKSKLRPTGKKKVTTDHNWTQNVKSSDMDILSNSWHFVLQLDTQNSVLVPAKQTKQQQAQAAETNLTRMRSMHSLNRISDKKTTQKTAETMKHTQAGSTKLKAAAKPKPKHAQQESFQTPQQTQLNLDHSKTQRRQARITRISEEENGEKNEKGQQEQNNGINFG